jgi:hypothetical protein
MFITINCFTTNFILTLSKDAIFLKYDLSLRLYSLNDIDLQFLNVKFLVALRCEWDIIHVETCNISSIQRFTSSDSVVIPRVQIHEHGLRSRIDR